MLSDSMDSPETCVIGGRVGAAGGSGNNSVRGDGVEHRIDHVRRPMTPERL
jgi:hypothetical protein